jgi:uncharacterized membrane protein YGL010W
MTSLVDRLSQYASYHRDRRNIATHLVGIPMIVLGVEALLARPSVVVQGLPLSAALAATLAGVGFYFTFDRRYGVAMAALLIVSLWIGTSLAALSTGGWLLGAAGLFLGGWVFQFVGHAFEGKKPAFVDDVVGLLIGPLFVVAELGFALGLRLDVREAIELRVGPTTQGAGSPPAHRAPDSFVTSGTRTASSSAARPGGAPSRP